MTILSISPNAENILSMPDDLDGELLSSFPEITDSELFAKEAVTKNKYLTEQRIDDIITFFDELSISLISRDAAFNKYFGHLGVSYLIHFFKRRNLEALLEMSLKGNIHFLDDFLEAKTLGKYLMALPKGVIVHWLSGNVPVLGMLSLIQGILTKNVNIVKLPKENGFILPKMVACILDFSINIQNGHKLTGKDIFNGVEFVYCSKHDTDSQHKLSRIADVRVAWGGKEAVEAVVKSPRKYDAIDVIFGPKYSFAAIGKDSFPIADLGEISYKIALDASIFEQKGCNSPHTIFVEEGGEVTALELAKALSIAMDKVLKRIPKSSLSAEESIKIVNLRSEYEFFGEIFSSSGTEWTVLYSEDEGFADACYNRTIFVRPIQSIDQVISYIDHSRQSLGLCICDRDKFSFAKKVTAVGIERVTDLGKMSVYEHPWDGRFPMESFVRWVSLH